MQRDVAKISTKNFLHNFLPCAHAFCTPSQTLAYLTPHKGIRVGKKRREEQSKSLRHREFPGGPPSKYYPGPTMLNFRDQTRTGVFIVVWSQAEIVCLSFLLFYIQRASEQTVEIGLALHPLFLSPCFSNKM